MIFATPLLPIDNLSRFMLVLVAFLFPLIFIYSLSYVKRNLFRYYFVLFITLGGMLGTVLARDFLSFYIFLEIMTVGIYFLIIDNTKKESFAAGFKYILMMFAGGIFVLVATLMLYNLTGTFEIAEIARIVHTLPQSAVMLIFTLFAIGCLFEIGAVPFHIWLPDAHPVAPSPISALLSGVAIKVGAYGIIRMLFTLQVLNSAIIFTGVISMLFGVVLALKQTNVKRLLAYSSISQMGYVLLGISVGTGIGMAGGLFHILNHAIFKMLLFLCMGAVIYATGKRDLGELGGLGKRMPVTFVAFGIATLAITGMPLFNGFVSKAMISESVSVSFLLKLVIVLTSAGTLAVFIKLLRHTFLGKLPEKLKNTSEAPILMLLPMLVLAGACLGIGLFPTQLLSNLIAPALYRYGTGPSIGSMITFDFWNIKIFFDTFLIIFLGVGIYIFGSKMGFLGIGKEATAPYFTHYLSLDKICCDAASALERGCIALKRLHTRSLNAHLLWVFLALVALLFLLGCGGPRYDKSQKPPDWLLAKEKHKTIEIDGYKTKCSISGQGIPIVFIPGLSGTKDNLSAYQKLRERFKCISYNLRGLADDGNELTDYGIEQLSLDLDALFTKLNLGKAILVGNSYGGTVALQFTLDHPEKVKALILKGAFAKFDFNVRNNILALGVKYAPDFLYRLAVRKHVEDIVAKGEPEWAYDYVLGQDLSIPRETAIQRIESLKKFDLRDKLSEIRVPTLIIVGSQDELTGLKYQLYLGSHIPNSYIKVIKGVGHLVGILKPEEYEQVILDFIFF